MPSSASQGAHVLNTLFCENPSVTLPVGFIIFISKMRFRAIKRPAQGGGSPWGSQDLDTGLSGSPALLLPPDHTVSTSPPDIRHTCMGCFIQLISNAAQSPHQGSLHPQVKRTAFLGGQRRCSNAPHTHPLAYQLHPLVHTAD